MCRVVRREDPVGAFRKAICDRRDCQGYEDGGDDDQRAPCLREIGNRGRRRARRGRGQHRDCESDKPNDRPKPADADDREEQSAHAGLECTGLGERAVQLLALGPRSVGCGEGDHQEDEEDRRHHQIDVRPAHPGGHHQCDGTADDRGSTIAELGEGGEQLDRGLLVGLIDAPSVDRDVVACRRQRGREGEQHEIADRGRRVGQREQREARRNDHLTQRDPALAAADAFKAGDLEPVYDRRPQKLERVSEADPREDTDGRELDPDFAEPCRKCSDQQREREARGEAEGQHRRGLARRERRLEQLETLGPLACHLVPSSVPAKTLDSFHGPHNPAVNDSPFSRSRRSR